MRSKNIIIIGFVFLFHSFNLKGQELTIGDKVPDVVFSKVLNYSSPTAKLSDFKGKLIILDFWSTWCSTCIQLFPHLNDLQKEFGDKIQVLLINGQTNISKDDAPKINKTLERLRLKAGVNIELPVIYDCPVLDEYFYYKSIPHEVWISPEGKVIAITSATEVTGENIQAFLEGKALSLHQKKDFRDFDSKKPLFVEGNGGEGDDFMYRSIITGYKEGLGGTQSGINLSNNGKISRYYFLNSPLLFIYSHVYKFGLPRNRVLVEVGNASMFKYSEANKYETLFCYELITPPSTEAEIRNYMQQDMERCFGTLVKKDKRKISCLVLSVNGKPESSYTRGGTSQFETEDATKKKFIHNQSIERVISFLNRNLSLPLVDETSISQQHLDIDLPFDLSDVEGLKQSFKKAGFRLEETQRVLDVIVISDKEKK